MKTKVESKVKNSYKKYGLIFIKKCYWENFPQNSKIVELVTDINTYETKYYIGKYRGFSTNLQPWFREHKELNEGVILIINTIKQDEKYRLEIV